MFTEIFRVKSGGRFGRFQCRCRSIRCLHLHCYSQKLSPPPLPLYPLNLLHCSTQDNCGLRTNVLPSEDGFNQAGFEESILRELLKYLNQQNLSPVPLLPAMQEIQGNMDDLLQRETIFRTMKKLSDTFNRKTDNFS